MSLIAKKLLRYRSNQLSDYYYIRHSSYFFEYHQCSSLCNYYSKYSLTLFHSLLEHPYRITMYLQKHVVLLLLLLLAYQDKTSKLIYYSSVPLLSTTPLTYPNRLSFSLFVLFNCSYHCYCCCLLVNLLFVIVLVSNLSLNTAITMPHSLRCSQVTITYHYRWYFFVVEIYFIPQH